VACEPPPEAASAHPLGPGVASCSSLLWRRQRRPQERDFQAEIPQAQCHCLASRLGQPRPQALALRTSTHLQTTFEIQALPARPSGP
jgi:hypothetical protein